MAFLLLSEHPSWHFPHRVIGNSSANTLAEKRLALGSGGLIKCPEEGVERRDNVVGLVGSLSHLWKGLIMPMIRALVEFR